MKLDDWVARAKQLVALGNQALSTQRTVNYVKYVDLQAYSQFASASLSFVKNCFGQGHPYYENMAEAVGGASLATHVEKAKGVFAAIINEMEGGWLTTARGLVSAEIFVDFLEMGDHLLSEGYKDPAAVMIGCVLEEHLRELARKSGAGATFVRDGRDVPKKAETINAELSKAGVYSLQDQKQVTAWLDLRNNAAHGHPDKYVKEQVQLMLDGVRNFMIRIPV